MFNVQLRSEKGHMDSYAIVAGQKSLRKQNPK
jgi:hypothetical protein